MIEVKPLNEFPEAVYVDGLPLPKQTIGGLISHFRGPNNGYLSVECVLDSRIKGCVNPDEVKYQDKPYEIIPATESEVGKVRFWFGWT